MDILKNGLNKSFKNANKIFLSCLDIDKSRKQCEIRMLWM